MAKNGTPKSGQRKATKVREIVVPNFDGLNLRKRFDALRSALDEAGHDDAVDVLERVEAAVFHPGDGIEGQRLTHSGVLAKMAKLARETPTRKGQGGRREVPYHNGLIELVVANREKGRPDGEIAELLVHMWSGFFRVDPDRKLALLDDSAAMAKLPHLDAGRFVRNVGAALGHGAVMRTLTNAKDAKNYRANSAKKKALAAARAARGAA